MGTPNEPDEQEALLRALRAPGSTAELAEEKRYTALFAATRDAAARDGAVGADEVVVPLDRRSRTPHRILAGSVVAAALAVTTGGVAAAYTGSLPDPIQNLAHHVIGAPSPKPSAQQPAGPVTGAPPASSGVASPSPASSASPHRQPSHRPTPPRQQPTASAPATPSAAPSGVVTPTPTPTPAPVVTGVSIAGTSHRADVGARLVFTGRVTTAAGAPGARQKVVLQQRLGNRWVRVAGGVSNVRGAVTIRTPPLQRTTVFRLRTAGVLSASWRVAMHPLLTATATTQKKNAVVVARVQGGDQGDRVTLLTRRNGRLAAVATGRLAADGSVSFRVTPTQRQTRYVVVLARTGGHTSAQTSVQVVLKPGRAG